MIPSVLYVGPGGRWCVHKLGTAWVVSDMVHGETILDIDGVEFTKDSAAKEAKKRAEAKHVQAT